MLPTFCLCAALGADPISLGAEAELSEAITEAELKAHVYRLASPEFLGRRGPGAARASQHIAAAFGKLKLAPAFADSYFQPIPWLLSDGTGTDSGFVGRNVGCFLPGSDPLLKDEWILLSAHFDHLGQSGETIYPGADDNASGIAMLLEVAEAFGLAKKRPRRNILFVAFDLEEQGLQGSAHFAAHPPRPFAQLKAFLTADLIGRSMADVTDEYLFVLGSETAPELRRLLTNTPPENELKIGRLGADLVGTRSDYGPFRDRSVPFLFFTTGTHADYHRPTDLPERIDYAKLARVSRYIHAVTDRLANSSDTPAWDAKGPGPDIDEARTVLMVLSRVLARPQVVSLTNDQRARVEAARERLEGIVGRGQVTPQERTWLVWTARMLMATVF
ncbi:MAG TPA: M28 family peptidase [Gemmataceae bacterium]|jgi:Peptidase family M28|nr:M28 family peptidase [Gemmataceae bacterium]